MLNSFPDLLTYSRLAPLILRLVSGIIFANMGVLAFRGEKGRWVASLSALKVPNPKISVKILGGLEVLGGLMLIFGFYTQIAALILSVLTFAEAYVEYRDPLILKRNFVFYTMILSILISLLFSGAGAFAIDIPL